ncbi:FAD-binding domain-containing protein [Dichomitus squalens LYAD-421 SS1]|uniref:FAD-binding domain-containing protein n=1 Tax=Dichomitus squalens (strain LYAD-421) TaxID=732165 RepID=UPI00044148FC|nr:FAD-binding domain-containing protein [Dichomitus squalens LYAD-421 SS1]EJF63609.1 FAD-binding domain-containing protein [Dichomitus squalens LYAD-421 SS1]
MVVAHTSALSLPLLFALLGAFDRVRGTGVDALLNTSTKGLKSNFFDAFDILNITVGGRLHKALPFERPCFSIVEGKHVNVSEAACAALQANYTNPVYRVEHFGAYMLPQWETCQASNFTNGCLLDSSNPSNPLAYEGVNCRLGNVPTHYIDVKYVEDVQAALAFSALTGVRLSVKNKGHDYKGRSSGKNTLALWTTGLRDISHDDSFTPEGCSLDTTYDTITTGAGVVTQDVYEYADGINRTIIAGYHQTIGFSGGYFLGGGHSILSPVYGLAADRVVQVKVVTPDGIYRTANECQNQELFFALRGGGGSAFGVVIESTHRTEPRFPVQAASLKFTPTGTDLADWYSLLVNNSLQWANDGWGGHIVGPTLLHVTPLLNNSAAQASMQSAVDFVKARNGSVVIEELPSYLAFFNKYVTAAQAAVGPELELGTRLLPSSFFSTDSGRAQLSALIKDTLSFASPYIVAGTPWLYKPLDGAAGETSVTPAWRDAIWHLSIKWQFQYNDKLEERVEGYRTLSAHIQKFRDLTPGSGAYFNEGDVYEPDHENSYWGADNYRRLLAVKRKYDPLHLLDCWQCVGWKGEDDDLYQCHIKL